MLKGVPEYLIRMTKDFESRRIVTCGGEGINDTSNEVINSRKNDLQSSSRITQFTCNVMHDSYLEMELSMVLQMTP